MGKVSRRQLMHGGSALVIGTSLASGAPAAARGRRRADVCVIGAGYAGLTAAYRLKQAGRKVIVLEARNRVGGRSLTADLEGGGWIDFGGQWVGPTQDRFYALIKEMGGETYPSPDFGKTRMRGILDPSSFVQIASETDGRYPGSELVEAGFKKIDDLAASVDRDKPWDHPDAERLDATTFAAWLRANIDNENARAMVGDEVSSIACASPQEISILEIAFLVRACNGLDRLFNTEGGAQQDRLIGGTQPIARKVADRLGNAILLGKPVRRIQWTERETIVYSDDISVEARHVIVCTPPHLAGAIEYDPSPPTNRVQVTQRWPQGLVIKVQMVYSEPFWRPDFNGASLDYRGVVGETADSGVPEQYSKKGIMTGFIYSGQARKVAPLPAAERRKLVLDEMNERFGPKALNPIDYHEMNWSTQQWTRGCFTGFLTPGATWLFRSAVRDPVGPLHWAGTETSTVWPSFIDGAIRSGERAAAEVQERS
ncbi:MAG TPA: flavin monoamine oxidase family protein [Xanthobacteraceae bacterium]